MMTAASDPDDILAEINFNVGLLDYEGAREAAKTVLQRVVDLASKKAAGKAGHASKALIEDLSVCIVADLMPRPQAASETSSAAAMVATE